MKTDAATDRWCARFNRMDESRIYQKYLKSRHWRRLRMRVLRRDRFRCTACRRTADEVHHCTYDRLFCEPLDDLLSLCEPCHHKAHGIGCWDDVPAQTDTEWTARYVAEFARLAALRQYRPAVAAARDAAELARRMCLSGFSDRLPEDKARTDVEFWAICADLDRICLPADDVDCYESPV